MPTPRQPRIRRAAGVVLTLAAAAGATWYLRPNGAADPGTPAHAHGAPATSPEAAPVVLAPEVARRIGITYAVAAVGGLQREVRTVALVTYDETRVKAIAPKVEGWVEDLYVNFTGQEVQRGDPLLRLYAPLVVTAQEELLVARRLLQQVRSTDDSAAAQAMLDASRRRLLYWDIPADAIDRLERTGTVEKYVLLRAPIGGTVVEKSAYVGSRIMAGESVYRIADLSLVWLEGEVFEKDIALIQLGQRVEAMLDGYPGRPLSGTVSYVYPELNPATRTFRIRVEVPNPRRWLKPGMYATIRVAEASERAAAVTVPRSALLVTGKRDLVFVRQADGMLVPREVTRGIASDDRVEILRGLAAGETVVASGTFLVDAESNLGSALGGMGDMPGMAVPNTEPPRSGKSPEPPSMDNMPGMTAPNR